MEGISNLFGKGRQEESKGVLGQIAEIELDALSPNQFQPRKVFDSDLLNELSKSIAAKGVIQPIVVRRSSPDRYEIVAGERRWRAAKIAGLKTIPAVIKDYKDHESAEISLIENVLRTNLDYFEEAEGYRRLIDEFGMTQEEVASIVNRSQPTIANKLRILRLDPRVRESIWPDVLTERHARALLRVETPEEQLLILAEVYNGDLSVKDTELLIENYQKGLVKLGPEADAEQMVGGDDDGGLPERNQTVTWKYSDMRIPINTIVAAVTSIQKSGVDATYEQEMTEDEIKLIITMPRIKKQTRS